MLDRLCAGLELRGMNRAGTNPEEERGLAMALRLYSLGRILALNFMPETLRHCFAHFMISISRICIIEKENKNGLIKIRFKARY